MKMNLTKIGWFIGVISIFIVTTVITIVKQIGIMQASSIMGIIVLVAAPFIGWLLKVTKKTDDSVRYAEKGNRYFKESRQKLYWRMKSFRSMAH